MNLARKRQLLLSSMAALFRALLKLARTIIRGRGCIEIGGVWLENGSSFNSGTNHGTEPICCMQLLSGKVKAITLSFFLYHPLDFHGTWSYVDKCGQIEK